MKESTQFCTFKY